MNNENMLYGILEESLNICNQLFLMYIIKQCDIKIDYEKILIVMFALLCSFTMGEMYGYQPLSLFVNLGIQFLVFMSVVKVNINVKILLFIFTLVLETFFTGIGNLIVANITNMHGLYEISGVIVKVMITSILAITILYKKNKYEKYVSDMNSLIYVFLTIGFLSGLLMILVVYIFGNKFTVEMNFALVILAFVTVIANVILYGFYNKKHKENLAFKTELVSMEQVIGLQEKYFQDTVQSYKDLRRFRHDINGYFNTIDGLILHQQYDELALLTKNLKNEIDVDIRSTCNNIYVSATLNQFLPSIKEQTIEFTFSYDVLAEIKIENSHICSLLYNLMSNAIEGCLLSPYTKIINLAMYKKNRALIINISNSVSNDFTLASLQQGKTNKKENHGLGLKNINAIVDKYHGNITYEFQQYTLGIYIVLLDVL